MTLGSAFVRLMGGISVGMAINIFRMILGWIDRWLDPPVMRERINRGTDRFFDHEEKHWGELEIENPTRFKLASTRRPQSES